MGMYTEIFVRAEVDDEAAEILRGLVKDGIVHGDSVPDHPFFQTERWRHIAHGGSYYFPQANHGVVEYDDITKSWHVSFRASLKNYQGEIGKFFDWLAPHVKDQGFLGYSLYEEAELPTLYALSGGQVRVVAPPSTDFDA